MNKSIRIDTKHEICCWKWQLLHDEVRTHSHHIEYLSSFSLGDSATSRWSTVNIKETMHCEESWGANCIIIMYLYLYARVCACAEHDLNITLHLHQQSHRLEDK